MTNQTTSEHWRAIGNGFCLLISGGGVGWLLGLSASPILQGAVTTILALIVSVAGVLAGVSAQQEGVARNLRVNALPVAGLMIGIVSGVCGGIYMRAHNSLSPTPIAMVTPWTKIGLDQKQVAQRFFDATYGAQDTNSTEKDTRPPNLPSQPVGDTKGGSNKPAGDNATNKGNGAQQDSPPKGASNANNKPKEAEEPSEAGKHGNGGGANAIMLSLTALYSKDETGQNVNEKLYSQTAPDNASSYNASKLRDTIKSLSDSKFKPLKEFEHSCSDPLDLSWAIKTILIPRNSAQSLINRLANFAQHCKTKSDLVAATDLVQKMRT